MLWMIYMIIHVRFIGFDDFALMLGYEKLAWGVYISQPESE